MTGLIYVILISLWGVVLVPRWLRHHDEAKRRRESERMERALNPHVAPEPHDSELDHHEYTHWREYLRSLTRRPAEGWQAMPLIESLRSPRSSQARRRRTIVVALAGIAGVSLLGVLVGVLPGFLAVLTMLLLSAYLTAMYLQMRQWDTRSGVTHQSAADRDTYAAGTRSVRDGVRVVPQERSDAWEPVATTPPLYQTKPKASKIPRRIDLTDRGWTGADMVEQARAQQSPQLQEQFEREFAAVEPEVDEQVDELANYRERYYRRAVNE